MNRVTSVITAPFRAMAAAGGAVLRGSQMAFARTAGAWQILFGRTRIDYRSEVGEPMLNSAAAAVVGWVSRNFPEAPVRIRREGVSGEDAIVLPALTGPGFMIKLLERPNDHYSGVLQWMATIADFVHGNAYWIKTRSDGGRVNGLWWVPASLIEPMPDDNNDRVFISHYRYTVNGEEYHLHPRNVVHFRQGIDPSNPRKGLSRWGALWREVFTDEEASSFTATLLRNLGVPGVIIAPANTTTTSTLSRFEPESVKQTFMEKFSGDRRGEPLVLTTPTEVKVLSWSPNEMNLRELRRIPEERISAVIGVPAGVAGLGAGLDRSTFNNFAEANRAAYTQGVIPLQRLIAAELERQLLTEFIDEKRESFEVEFDWAKATAMQEAAADVWRRWESAAKAGLVTRGSFKRAVGIPSDDGDNVYVVANNIQFVPAGGNPPPSGLLIPSRSGPDGQFGVAA